MDILMTVLIFYTLVVLSTFAVLPLIVALPHPDGAERQEEDGCRVFLAMGVGVAAFLVIFSLVARVLTDYRAVVFVTLATMGLWLLPAFRAKPRIVVRARNLLPLLVFLALHLLLWSLRWSFSDIHFDPNRFGAEKLFNLSLQQSFLFGQGFPPESHWLAGEKEAYYILPRILPGVAAHFARLLGGGREVAGVAFHFGDTFFHVLAAAVTFSGVWLFSRRARDWSGRVVLGILGLLPLLCIPWRALSQAVEGRLEMWSLSRIIDNTINEYPFWNYLWADNHAHSNGAFLDVALIVFSLWFLRASLKTIQPWLGVLVGFLASAVYMAQSGSVMIVLCALAPAGLWWMVEVRRAASGTGWRGFLRLLEERLSVPLATALLLSLPDLATRPQPRVAWALVPPRLASDLWSWLNVEIAPVVVFLAAFIFMLWASGRSTWRTPGKIVARTLPLLALAALCAAFLGYPVIGVALLLWALALPLMAGAVAHGEGPSEGLRHSILGGAAALAILPEIVAANFNMGADLIRMNTVFKFQYDAFYLWPVLVAFALRGGFWNATAAVRRSAAAGGVVFFLFALWVQGATLAHRLHRQRNPPSASGLAYFQRERPYDDAISEFLFRLPGRVVIAEECGVPPKPASYAVAGRISALSGRPAVCGWGMHTFLHHNNFWSGERKGQPVWPHLLKVNDALRDLFEAARGVDTSGRQRVAAALEVIRKAGATHLVFGEWEKEHHASATLEGLAAVAGSVVFRTGTFGVIALAEPGESATEH